MSLLSYTLEPAAPESHRLFIHCRVPAELRRESRELALAAWTPGSYKIRDYARHVLAVTAQDASGRLRPEKADKQTWRLPAGDGDLDVTLEIYARDDSVRGAFLNHERGLFDGAGLFPRLVGQEHLPVSLDLLPPPGTEDWTVVTSMNAQRIDARGWGRYNAADWAELIDHPIGMGQPTRLEFEAGGRPHAIAIFGRHATDLEALRDDLTRVCEQHIAHMGEAPQDRYLFLLRLGDGGDGGLEHRWSSTLATGRSALPRRLRPRNADYRRFLGLCSHEYFHLWNVKRLRPQRFAESLLDREAHSEDLWAYEGVTSYLDDYALRRAGLLGPDEYLQNLAEALTRLSRTPGRQRQSLAESSFDAWIRLYQPAEHLPYSTVSYYLKGSLVALALDLELRRRSDGRSTLIDVMRGLWQRSRGGETALPERSLESVACELAGAELAAFFDRYVRGTEDPDYAALLGEFGLRVRRRPACSLSDPGGRADSGRALRSELGLRLEPDSLRVQFVDFGSAAESAGLQPGDELLACNDARLTRQKLEAALAETEPGERLRLHWFSDGLLRDGEMAPPAAAESAWELLPDTEADALRQRRRQEWLGDD